MPSKIHPTSIHEAWKLAEDLRDRWGWVLHVDARKVRFEKAGHSISAIHEDGRAENVAVAISRARDKVLAIEASPAQAERGTERIILVSCAKTKAQMRTHAATLYDSPLFRKMRAYAEEGRGPWYILSALHGLVHPNDVLAPYDHTLADFLPEERQEWAGRVAAQLCLRHAPPALVEIHAGEAYAACLEEALGVRGFRVQMPLRGLRVGERLQWYKQRAGR